MKRLLLALAMLFTLPAQALTGNDALEWHESSGGQRSLTLLAYLRGALDDEESIAEVLAARAEDSPPFKAVWIELAPKMFCRPNGATPAQAYDLLIKWLREHPEHRQKDLAAHLRVALRQAWPCVP